jgi:hypothetical protein
MLDMLAAGGWDHFDQEMLGESCRRVGFYRVLQRMYEKDGEVTRILECYLKDELRTVQAFSFLQNVLSDGSQPAETKETIRAQLAACLGQLAMEDARRAAQLVCCHLRGRAGAALARLPPRQRYDLLAAVVECREAGHSQPSTPVHGGGAEGAEQEDYLHSAALYRDYVALMLEFEPAQVTAFLLPRPGCCPGPELLALAQAASGQQELQVMLLEREGRPLEAFALLLAGLQEKVAGQARPDPAEGAAVQWTGLNTALVAAVAFCHRASAGLATVEEREALWCPLLAAVSAPPSRLDTSRPEVVARWRDLVRHVVSSMLGHVSHGKVVAAVLADPGGSETSNWPELRRLLGEIMDTFR